MSGQRRRGVTSEKNPPPGGMEFGVGGGITSMRCWFDFFCFVFLTWLGGRVVWCGVVGWGVV